MKKLLCASFVMICAFVSCNSQQKKILQSTKDIVIINVGKRYRLGVAQEIAIINKLKPKVVAIDAYFPDRKDSYSDSLLIEELKQCNDLVMISLIADYKPEENINYEELTGSLPEFLGNGKLGFANSIFEKDQFQTLRRFSIYEKVNDLIIYHFAISAAMQFDSLKTMQFVNGKPRIIDVDYIGDEKMFKTFSDFDVFNGKVKKEDIEGKIVLFGYLGPYKDYKGDYDEDKHFSTMNGRIPPYKPDMYGVVYHANIIAQVLRD